MPRKLHFALILSLVAGLPVLAQDEPPKGAKEMFFDPQQGSTDVSRPRTDAPPSHAPKFDAAGRRIPHSTSSAKQTALGLSYWIELADASGNISARYTFVKLLAYAGLSSNFSMSFCRLSLSVLFRNARASATDGIRPAMSK